MSDLHPPFDPHKSLRRAAKIPATNGHVAQELVNMENGNSTLSVTTAKNRGSGLGASIKGKFKTRSEFERSKSLNNLFSVSPIQKDGLARSSRSVGTSSHPGSKTNESSHHLSETFNCSARPTMSSPPPMENITVPDLIQQGTLMTKVSSKTNKNVVLRVEADLGQIVWESRQQKIIPIENIKEIRSGSDARYYRQQFQLSRDYEDRWLTIIYVLDGAWKTLHLIAPTKDVFRMWDKTLREQHAIRQELMRGLGNPEMRETLWEKHYWKGADGGGDQKLTFDEVEKLCRGLNIKSNREDLGRLFTEADVQNRGYLDFSDFRRFVKLLKGRPEVNRLYQKLKGGSDRAFDLIVFENFMREQQKSLLSGTEIKSLYDKYTISDDSYSPMSLDAFTSFLLSPDNSPFSDQHRSTWHDMTRPLPEYFISSSHNTYLVGHQLVGDSTIEGYIRALLHGCRSVEVDVYDGENEPVIFHGKTLTSKVSLREVCEVIAKYGFIASPYPIIISAEVHCSLSQQDLIAEIMIEVFGDMLVRKLPGDPPNKLKTDTLPSPEDLKGKILFKTKNHEASGTETSESDGGVTTEPSSSASDSDALMEALQDASVSLPASSSAPVCISPAEKMTHRRSQSGQIKEQLLKARSAFLLHVRGAYGGSGVASDTILDHGLSQSPPSEMTAFPATPSTPKASSSGVTSPRVKAKISVGLLGLLVYTVGVKCRGINKKEQYAPEHMFSLSENAANKMLRFNMWDVIKHTKSHMVRIYPKGTRVGSSNYEPHKFWAAGVQLVALNWQTPDLGCMLNHAMFQRNGRSGYVLKPTALQQNSPKDLLLKRTRHTLDITVISAQQLPHRRDAFGKEVQDKALVDPYVEVTLYVPDWPVRPVKSKEGASKDAEDPSEPLLSPASASSSPTSTSTRARSVRTSVVKKNGFNPVWEEKLSISFECVGDMFDLIFVKFVVGQEDRSGDEPLALYCASLGSLQRGYRHLPLHDSQLSQYLYSTLFVKTDVLDTS